MASNWKTDAGVVVKDRSLAGLEDVVIIMDDDEPPESTSSLVECSKAIDSVSPEALQRLYDDRDRTEPAANPNTSTVCEFTNWKEEDFRKFARLKVQCLIAEGNLMPGKYNGMVETLAYSLQRQWLVSRNQRLKSLFRLHTWLQCESETRQELMNTSDSTPSKSTLDTCHRFLVTAVMKEQQTLKYWAQSITKKAFVRESQEISAIVSEKLTASPMSSILLRQINVDQQKTGPKRGRPFKHHKTEDGVNVAEAFKAALATLAKKSTAMEENNETGTAMPKGPLEFGGPNLENIKSCHDHLQYPLDTMKTPPNRNKSKSIIPDKTQPPLADRFISISKRRPVGRPRKNPPPESEIPRLGVVQGKPHLNFCKPVSLLTERELKKLCLSKKCQVKLKRCDSMKPHRKMK